MSVDHVNRDASLCTILTVHTAVHHKRNILSFRKSVHSRHDKDESKGLRNPLQGDRLMPQCQRLSQSSNRILKLVM